MRVNVWKRALAALAGCTLLMAAGCGGGDTGSAVSSQGGASASTGTPTSTSAAASETTTTQTPASQTESQQTQAPHHHGGAAANGERTTDIGIWYSTWYAKKVDNSPDNKNQHLDGVGHPLQASVAGRRYGTYDSLSLAVTLFHLKMMSEAQIRLHHHGSDQQHRRGRRLYQSAVPVCGRKPSRNTTMIRPTGR